MRYALAWTVLAFGLAAVQWRLEAAITAAWMVWGARAVLGYGVVLSAIQAGNYYAYAAGGDPAGWLRHSGNPFAALVLCVLWPYAKVARVLNVAATVVLREDRCNTVAPGLVIGSAPVAGHRKALEEAGVDAVCNVCFEFPGLLGPSPSRPQRNGSWRNDGPDARSWCTARRATDGVRRCVRRCWCRWATWTAWTRPLRC
jgi:hypothetical protein